MVLAHPVQVMLRLDEVTRDRIDALAADEAKRTGLEVSRAAMCRILVERGLRETERKRK